MSPARSRSAAILLSGGKGLRLGSDIPKQYIELKEKPVLGYTIEAFEKSNVDEIIIVAAAEYLETCWKIAERVGSCKVTAVIGGGAERYDSVLNGLRYLASREMMDEKGAAFQAMELCHVGKGVETPEIVLIHDGARPFIRPAVINEIIDCVAKGMAAIAAAPCTDTIKIADESGCIASTTDRSRTWAAQTPQAFRTEEICRAYEEIIGSAGGSLTGITDDAMVYQMAFQGRKVQLIHAGQDNFKITTADDLSRAESLLAAREEKQS